MIISDNFYIKISKIKINIFSPISIFILYLNESLISLSFILGAVLIHEFGHLITTYVLHSKISFISFEPFGITICLDEFTDYKSELIIAASGPLTGLCASIIGIFLMRSFPSFYLLYFIVLNLVYSLINIIPCSELDGGKIVAAYLNQKYDIYRSYKKTELINKISSVVLITIIITICFMTGFNFSLTSLCVFIITIFPNKKVKYKIKI